MAILLILVLHAGVLTPGLAAHPVLQLLVGRLGVGMQMFFVLSGYLISRSWDVASAHPNALARYATRRAAKIVPLYLLALHLNIGLFWLLSNLDPDYQPFRNSVTADNLLPLNYLAHLLFLQGLLPAWQHSLVDGSWSVVAEVYFYALYPLLLARHCRHAKGVFLCYLCSLLLAMAAGLALRHAAADYSYYNLLSQLPCFLLGVLVHRLEASPAAQAVLARWAEPLLMLCVLLALGMVHSSVRPLGIHQLYAIVFALALAALPHWEPTQRDGWLQSSLRLMGQRSYALFFAHLLLLKLQYYVLVDRAVLQGFAPLLMANLTTATLGSMVVAKWLMHPIDQHIVAWARQRTGSQRESTV